MLGVWAFEKKLFSHITQGKQTLSGKGLNSCRPLAKLRTPKANTYLCGLPLEFSIENLNEGAVRGGIDLRWFENNEFAHPKWLTSIVLALPCLFKAAVNGRKISQQVHKTCGYSRSAIVSRSINRPISSFSHVPISVSFYYMRALSLPLYCPPSLSYSLSSHSET